MPQDNNISNLVQALLTDKYQINQCYTYWRHGRHVQPAVFDLYFRRNPFKGEYTVFAGLDECLKCLNNFRFSEDDVQYLRSIPDYAHIDGEFWNFLQNIDTTTLKLFALNEGNACFPNLPLVRVEGPLGLLQILESSLLNLIGYASLVATNAARYRFAANSSNMNGCKLLEFGLRRAQGSHAALTASRCSYIGGFDATSNLLAGKMFGIPVMGTMSHSFITSYLGTPALNREDISEHLFLMNKKTGIEENFTIRCLNIAKDPGMNLTSNFAQDSELKAFIVSAEAFPNMFLALVDTYDVMRSGLINFCTVAMALIQFGYRPVGIRIDSGDLAYLSKFAKDLFLNISKAHNMNEFNNLEIVVSNDINEETINSLKDQKHGITSMGIGTHLVTCQNQPALGCVYKLVENNQLPSMKLSSVPEKTTIPFKKSAYRLFGKNESAILDLILMHDEPPPVVGKRVLCIHPFVAEKRCYATPSRVEPLLNLWWDGKIVKTSPSLGEIRKNCIKSLDYLTEDIKRSLNPTPYKVSVSEKLFHLLNKFKSSLIPIEELC